MGLALILFVGGLVILLSLYLWSRQRERLGYIPETNALLNDIQRDVPSAANGDAVLVAREHGQLIFINDAARHWLGMDGGDPNLELIARQAQPADTFLELFARELQASFQLAGHWVEASSHRIPGAGETRTVVVLRELSANTSHPEALDLSAAMRVINDIGETINASLGVEQVLQALLTIVQRVLPADAGELCIWKEEDETLYPRGWVGDVAYVLALSEAGGAYKVGEGISGWIARHRKAVLVSNVLDETAVRPKLKDSAYKSFVAVPLMLGDRFVGTLEFAAVKSRTFGQSDLALLQAVANQVAISIYNAELYTEQAKRIDDISSLQEITQQPKSADDVSVVYNALTERIASLLDADMCGVLLYDERKQALVPEVPFHGLPAQLVKSYFIPVPQESAQRFIWESRSHWYTNDLTDEPLAEAMNLTLLVNAAGVYNTALVPMRVGEQRIGALQVCNKRTHGGFNQRDVQNLRILAAQASVVVENIRLYQREQSRGVELVGLQEMTQAIGTLSHESEFYANLNQRVAGLVEVAMCGILLYDEAGERLISRLPFYGIEDSLISDYVIDVRPDTPMGQIWRSVDYWYSNQVAADKVVLGAGLDDLAASIGISKTMLAVLSAGGRRLGVVQVSNKLNGEDFTERDARLLLIFATQAAAIMENARLYREVQRRAEEADSLRHIAELASAILTNEDSFTPVLAEISRLTDSPVVYIDVVDAQNGTLTTYPRNVYGAELTTTYVKDLYSKGFDKYSVVRSGHPFVSNDVPNDKRVLPEYARVSAETGVKTTVLVPLAVGDRELGELGIANRAKPPYVNEDIQVMTAIALQVSAALDRIRLYEATGHNLSRRLEELDAISRVSNELAQTLDLDRVLDVIRQEASRATDAQGSTVAMLMPISQWRAPDKPEIQRRIGERRDVRELADLEREAVLRGVEGVWVEDYHASPSKPFPASARSAVAASLIYADEPVGVIYLYSNEPHIFDDRAATFLMTLAAKASLAYGNALRYEENLTRSERLRRRVEQLNQIFELGQMFQGNVDPVTMLEAIAYSIQQSVGFDVVVMLLADRDSGVMRRIAQAGLPLDVFERSKSKTITQENFQLLLKDEYRTSESYFFPLERIVEWNIEGVEALGTSFEGNRSLYPRSKEHWRDGDTLLVPLHGPGGEMLGGILLDRPYDNLRPERSVIEVLEIFAHQAATTIENARLYLQSVRNAEQEARLNEVMEAIASTLNMEEIVEAIAHGALRLLPFMRMTVALIDSEQQGFDVLRVTVHNDDSLLIARERRANLERTALGRSFNDGQDYSYHEGDKTDDYEDLRAWQREGERTSLVVPMITGGLCLGAMHLGSDLMSAFGFEEYRALIKRIANLSAVAIQNARLFNQAVNLRSFNESVVQSIQQGIVVLDRSGRVSTINDYMRQRFGWDDGALRQDLFAYRPQLTPILAENVRLVMETGERQERVNQRVIEGGATTVQNYYIYPLRAADTVRGAVILVEDVTERTRLEEDIQARANQLAALTEVSSRITASLNRDEVVALALEEMGRVISYDTLTLWRREGDTMVLEEARGFKAPKSKKSTRVKISSHDRLRKVSEMQRSFSISRFQGWDALPGEEGQKSWLGVPLVRRGDVVGLLALSKAEPGFYDTRAEQAAFAFANQVAVALVNADLFTEAESRTQRLSLLNRVSLALAQSLDNENILEIGLREISGLLGAQRARAYFFERELDQGRVIVEQPRGDLPPSEVINLQKDPIMQRLRQSLRPLVYENVAEDAKSDDLAKEVGKRQNKAYALIPMVVGGQVVGAFEINFDEERHFEPEQIDLALVIANQAAIAVQNANLLEQTLVRTRELETLLEASQSTSFTLDLKEVFQGVTRLMLQAMDTDDCAVMMWDDVENALEVQLDVNRDGEQNKVSPSGTRYDLSQYTTKSQALRDRQVMLIREDEGDADVKELADLKTAASTARLLVPLVLRDQAIGLVQVELKSRFRTFTSRDIRLAQALGAQAATAIENARLSTETAAQVEELLVINDLSRAISATIDIPDMIRIVHDQVPNLTHAEELYLALYNAETSEVSFPMAVRAGGDFVIPPHPLGKDEVSFVIRFRRPLILGGDNVSLAEVRRNLGITTDEGEAKSYLGVPLIAGDQIVGVLAVRDTRHTRAFGLNDQRILTTVGTQLGAAIQNARLFAQIRSFADELNERVQERTLELLQERDRLDTLFRITAELARSLDIDRVLSRALEMVAAAVSADDGVIMLIDPMSDKLYNRASLHQVGAANGHEGDNFDTHGAPRPSHVAVALADWLLKQGERSVLVSDLRETDYWDAAAPGAEEWRSGLAVVLETNQDQQGVMAFLSREPGTFTEPHMKLVSAAASQAASAINNADLYNLIRDQAERLGTLLRAEQEEAEKNQAILEGIADGVMLADAQGVIVLYNTAAESILELPRDHVLGQPLSRLLGLYGGSAAIWIQAISDWVMNPARFTQNQQMMVERLDLGRRVVSIHLSPVNIGDQFLGTVSVFRDVTKDVEVDRMKSEFISNVSHELRTPMTSIKGYADLLLMGAAGDTSENQKRFLATIKVNADRLSNLVNDLLNISRIDAGSEKLLVEVVDLNEVINIVLANMRARTDSERKNITVTTHIEATLPPIKADRHKVTQIVANIVDNAFNYTYPGGTIDIDAHLEADKENVLISIKDSGIGIPQEFKSRIWERFERYEEHALVMDVAGTGLGLPIVKNLVDMHHGKVWFESEVNQGTTFYVSLPVEQPEETEVVSNEQPTVG